MILCIYQCVLQPPICLFLAFNLFFLLLFSRISLQLTSCSPDVCYVDLSTPFTSQKLQLHSFFTSFNDRPFCLCLFSPPFSHSTFLSLPPPLPWNHLFSFILLSHSAALCLPPPTPPSPPPKEHALAACKMIAAVGLLPTQGPS